MSELENCGNGYGWKILTRLGAAVDVVSAGYVYELGKLEPIQRRFPNTFVIVMFGKFNSFPVISKKLFHFFGKIFRKMELFNTTQNSQTEIYSVVS